MIRDSPVSSSAFSVSAAGSDVCLEKVRSQDWLPRFLPLKNNKDFKGRNLRLK